MKVQVLFCDFLPTPFFCILKYHALTYGFLKNRFLGIQRWTFGGMMWWKMLARSVNLCGVMQKMNCLFSTPVDQLGNPRYVALVLAVPKCICTAVPSVRRVENGHCLLSDCAFSFPITLCTFFCYKSSSHMVQLHKIYINDVHKKRTLQFVVIFYVVLTSWGCIEEVVCAVTGCFNSQGRVPVCRITFLRSSSTI